MRQFKDQYAYDQMAEAYLRAKPFEQIEPRCQAMFIDEAQDMGPNTLRLLTALVAPTNPEDPKSRAVNIFYDNAQDIFRRGTPRWTEIGLDMRGRSTVMKESFRSTRPVTEYALNVLYSLQPPEADPDHKELVERGLIECTQRTNGPWWSVHFNQVQGPLPEFKKFPSLAKQVDALSGQVIRWIREDKVRPGDIAILSNDNSFKEQIHEVLAPELRKLHAQVAIDPRQGWVRDDNTLVVSTSASYKGYESEIVIIAGVERFVGQKQILANALYVAMTRARSKLEIFAYAKKTPSPPEVTILSALEKCMDGLRDRPKVEGVISHLQDIQDLLEFLGPDHRDWLERLWNAYLIQEEPITSPEGEILAEPLFWFQVDDRRIACFGNEEPGPHTLDKLDDHRIEILRPGHELAP